MWCDLLEARASLKAILSLPQSFTHTFADCNHLAPRCDACHAGYVVQACHASHIGYAGHASHACHHVMQIKNYFLYLQEHLIDKLAYIQYNQTEPEYENPN